MVYYTVGAKEIYEENIKNNVCFKSEGGSVFKNIEDAKEQNVFIDEKKVDSDIYKIEGDWEEDVIDPTKNISELNKPKKVNFLDDEFFVDNNHNNELYDKRIFPIFCFLLANEKTDKLRNLVDTRIKDTSFGNAKGDNLNSINSILNELELILNDSTDFNYSKRHSFSSILWSIERSFVGEKLFPDLALTQDVSKEGIHDLLPKKKISISLKESNPLKSVNNLYQISKAYDFVINNNLLGTDLEFEYNINTLWYKKDGIINKISYDNQI